MAVTPEEFFSKNMKWIALGLLFLLLFSSIKSCNRKMQLNMGTKQYTQQIDSLKTLLTKTREDDSDSIKKLNFELRIATQRENSANERASAVQSAVEKIKSNTTTTVVVKGAEEIKDTTKKK